MTGHASGMHSIADIIRYEATRPNGGTLTCGSRVTSYEELDRRSNRVAQALVATAGPGARAGFLDTNSDAFFELLFGAAKAGVVLVPLNYRLALPELVRIVDHAEIDHLFVGDEFREMVSHVRAACPRINRVIWMDDDGADGYGVWRDAHPADDPRRAAARSDVALQVYTSGTLDRPKGVLLTHESLLTGVPMLVDEYVVDPDDDRALVCMPVYHVSGCLWALTCMYSGLSTVVLRKVSVAAIVDAVAAHRITMTLVVPTIIQLLLASSEREQAALSTLKLLIYGGSSIPPAVLERALATWTFDFAQVYGLTETGGAITYLTPADHRSGNRERLRSCGRVLRQADIRVVDAHGEVVPAGTAGEVVCRSPQNMQGYWRRDAERVLGDGWLRTGDVATLDADGYLFVHDRLDDMIVSGGENVYPSEVESVLTAHLAVADAGVVGVPDGRWGSRIVAFVVLAPGAAATADDLDTFLRGRIASFKVPKTITFVPALPRNAAGKLLRRELRASAT